MHWTKPATADDSPDCGDMSPLSRRDMSRARSTVVPAQSAQPTTSRFSHLLCLPEGANVGQSVNEAMRAIKKENPDLADVLPKSYHILDPACGSGGMFIQSARFVEAHQKNPTAEISVHGQERVTDTARLARLNLAVHRLYIPTFNNFAASAHRLCRVS